MELVCKQCGISFESNAADKLYCSAKCKDTARRRRRGERPLAKRGWQPGKRFNRLVLVARTSSGDSYRQWWLCDCDCGTKNFKCRADKLKNGRVQSCGCLRLELAQQKYERSEQRKREQDALRDELRAEKNSKRSSTEQKAIWERDNQKNHKALKYMLTADHTDPLWGLNYYSALIEDNECHYCRGPLPESGIALDTIDSDHIWCAYNVIPACIPCIERRNNYRDRLDFHEMEVLGGTLELIRLRREKT
jgi:hypothetical protein